MQEHGSINQLQTEVEVFVRIPRQPMKSEFGKYTQMMDRIKNLLTTILRSLDDHSSPHISHRARANASEVAEILFWRLRKVNAQYGRLIHLRSRRGAFDFIGDLGSSLFGIATEEDLGKVATAVEAMGDRQEIVIEHQNQLIGAVESLGNEVRKQKSAIWMLEAQVSGLTQTLGELLRETAEITRLLEVDVLLSVAENSNLEMEALESRAQLHVLMCQSGTVTEDLIPRSFLQSLSTFTSHGMALREDWYYGHLTVEQYFEKDNDVYCKVRIPLVHPESFLSRKIFTYPVRRNGIVTRVLHDAWVAIGTTSGRLFYPPDDCVGTDPTVCHAGMVFKTDQERCVRGIVADNDEYKKECNVHVTNIEQGHALVKTGRNAYVVYSRDGELTRRCPDKAPTTTHLAEGLYILGLSDSCVAETEEWRVEGVRYVTQRLTPNDTMTELILPTFPHINANWTQRLHVHLNASRLQNLNVNEDFVLKLPPTMEPRHINVWHPQHTSTALYILGAVAAIAILVFCGWLCFCGCPSCCCRACARKSDARKTPSVTY